LLNFYHFTVSCNPSQNPPKKFTAEYEQWKTMKTPPSILIENPKNMNENNKL